jgi:hypothetical protein
MPNPLHHIGGHADMDELGQMPIRGDHTQRRVTGTDKLAGRLHDPTQHRR